MHRSDRHFSCVIGSAALDGEGDYLLGGLMTLRFHLLLAISNDSSRLVGHLATNLIKKFFMGVLASKLGDTLELISLLLVKIIQLTRLLLNLPLLARKLMFTLIKRLVATIKRFLALHNAILENSKFLLAKLFLSLGCLLILNDLLFGFEESLFL